MNRLVDRCLLLSVGGLLGFLAARAAMDRAVIDVGIVAPPALAAGARAEAAEAPPARGERRRRSDREMQQLVDEVVGLRPSNDRRVAPLTEEEIDRCLMVARDIDPPLHDGLLTLRDADPEAFRRRLASSQRLRFLAGLSRDEPHLYELKLIELRTDREVARLSEELRAAAERDDSVAVGTLRPQLVAQMRVQQAFVLLARRQALDRMRERLEALERDYQQDVATVDERIRAEIDRIVGAEPAPAEPDADVPPATEPGG